MAAVASDITVTFDENYKVRVLDAERFKQTEALETECNEFVKRMDALRLAVQEFVFFQSLTLVRCYPPFTGRHPYLQWHCAITS